MYVCGGNLVCGSELGYLAFPHNSIGYYEEGVLFFFLNKQPTPIVVSSPIVERQIPCT